MTKNDLICELEQISYKLRDLSNASVTNFDIFPKWLIENWGKVNRGGIENLIDIIKKLKLEIEKDGVSDN